MPIQVVGVVRDARYSRLSEPAPATFFMPYTQVQPRRMTVGSPNRRRCARYHRCRPRRDTHDRSRPAADARAHTGRTDLPDHPRTAPLRRTDCWWLEPSACCWRVSGSTASCPYDAKRRTSEIGVRDGARCAQRPDVLRLVMGQTLWVVTVSDTLLGTGRLPSSVPADRQSVVRRPAVRRRRRWPSATAILVSIDRPGGLRTGSSRRAPGSDTSAQRFDSEAGLRSSQRAA